MGEYERWKRLSHATSRSTSDRQRLCAACSNSRGSAWYRDTANTNPDAHRSLPCPECSPAGSPSWSAGTGGTADWQRQIWNYLSRHFLLWKREITRSLLLPLWNILRTCFQNLIRLCYPCQQGMLGNITQREKLEKLGMKGHSSWYRDTPNLSVMNSGPARLT